jgi:hypothetical protein
VEITLHKESWMPQYIPPEGRKQNWLPALIVLGGLTVLTFTSDIWMLLHHTFNFNRHIPFLLTVAWGAFFAMVWRIKRKDETGR